jgi:Predicted membrane protein
MARAPRPARNEPRLDQPKGTRQTFTPFVPRFQSRDRFGRFTEGIARAMGTPWFLLFLTLFCAAWMIYNVIAEQNGWWRFDSAALGFTALTLILSLQASYAAPLILLAQNRQDDRDRVQIEQDRQRAERNLADTEYLAREVVALRLAMKDVATKDFIRAELRSLLEELDRESEEPTKATPAP